jgi:hypothetical protein
MAWCIEPHDFGVLETLVNRFQGYAIRMNDQDFEIIGVGRNESGWPGMEIQPVDDDMWPIADAMRTVVPFALDDVAFEVY